MQRFAEIAILSMVTIAFVVVGLRSAVIIKSALRTLATAEVVLVNKRSAAAANNHGGRDMQAIVDLTNSAKLVAEASDRGRLMKVKIVRTFMFIFLTCLVRSAVSFWFGIVRAATRFEQPVLCQCVRFLQERILAHDLLGPVHPCLANARPAGMCGSLCEFNCD